MGHVGLVGGVDRSVDSQRYDRRLEQRQGSSWPLFYLTGSVGQCR